MTKRNPKPRQWKMWVTFHAGRGGKITKIYSDEDEANADAFRFGEKYTSVIVKEVKP